MAVISAASAQLDATAAVELEWSAPRECPDRAAVLAALSQHWPKHGRTGALRASALVVRRGAVFHLQLDLKSDAGPAQRTLEDPQCAALAEAAAVLIALALDSNATSPPPATPEPEPEPEPEPQIPDATTSPDYTASSNLPEQSDGAANNEFHLQLTASARADLGTFPQQPALGVQAQLAARMGRLYLALGATYWTPRAARSDAYPSAQLSGSGIFSDLSLGLDVAARTVVFTPQLNVELGRLDAEALGIAGPERSHALWIAFGPAAALAVSVLDDWTIAFELGGLITAYRAHWLVRTPGADVPAFVSSSLVLRLALRVGYALR